MEETDFLQALADELSALPDPSYWFSELREIRSELGKSKCLSVTTELTTMFGRKKITTSVVTPISIYRSYSNLKG